MIEPDRQPPVAPGIGAAPRRPAAMFHTFVLAALLGGVMFSPLHAAEGTNNGGVSVSVVKARYACFSDMIRVTGFVVPKQEAVVNVDNEGSRVTDLFVHEGDVVAANQELAKLTPSPTGNARNPVTLRAPVAGLIIKVHTMVGAPASPQAEPMFRIAMDNVLEFDVEVPGLHMPKLNIGATARISRDGQPDLAGRIRRIDPQIDQRTQFGHVRVALTGNAPLRVGLFARVNIDAKRSCGVSIPRSAVDHSTIQVVAGDVIETRRVRTGLNSGTAVEILEGLKPDEIVVADAGTSLHDGDRVKPIFPDDSERVRGR